VKPAFLAALIALSLASSNPTYADEIETQKLGTSRTESKVELNNLKEVASRTWISHFGASAAIEYPTHDFLLAVGEGRSSLEATEKRLQFSTSNSPEGVFNVSWDDLRFEYRTKIDGLNSLAASGYQPGSLQGYRAAIDLKYYGLEVFYQEAKGFYVDLNSSSGWTVSEKHSLVDRESSSHETVTRAPKIWPRPDIGSTNYGLRAWLTVPLAGDEHSEVIFHSEHLNWLLFSGILSLGYQRLAIESGDPLIPQDRQNNFGIQKDLMGIYQHALAAQCGFRMDFMMTDRFRPYMEGVVGGESLLQSVQYRNDLKRELATGRVAQFDMGMVYQIAGLNTRAFYKTQIRSSTVESSSLDSMLSSLGLEVTYRF